MALDQAKRLNPKVLQADMDALAAAKAFMPVYTPADTHFALTAIDAAKTTMATAQATEVSKKGEAMAARDAANAAEWAFHNLMLGVKDQALAQYGADSDQIQAMGLKKKSERKRPAARIPATPPAPAH
jgi:hypothetical protein